MILSVLKRGEMDDWGLGRHKPPKDLNLPKGIELIWNSDELQWEVYCLTHKGAAPSDDELKWQISVPFTGLPITPAIRQWLQKYDTSEGGAVSLKQRKKRWELTFYGCLDRDSDRREKVLQESYYEVGHISRWLGRYASRGGAGSPLVTVPITVGYNKKTKKPIRMYQKYNNGLKKEVT